MIELEGVLTEDGKLLVQIPKGVTPGRVKITIDPIDTAMADPSVALTREEARRRLAAAGKLSEPEPLSETEELLDRDWSPVVLPPGSPGSEVLVDEDRGER